VLALTRQLEGLTYNQQVESAESDVDPLAPQDQAAVQSQASQTIDNDELSVDQQQSATAEDRLKEKKGDVVADALNELDQFAKNEENSSKDEAKSFLKRLRQQLKRK
jgi:hypothetical protein